jgi:hypothetical protein
MGPYDIVGMCIEAGCPSDHIDEEAELSRDDRDP